MPKIQANGIQLHYEISGEGTPIVFVHEFAGDYRSWEDQVRFFNRRYRTLVYNARGLPPTDVPGDVSDYSQDSATADLAGIIQALDLAPAHVVGLSILSGSHLDLVRETIGELRKAGLENVPLIVGGIIPPEDARALKQMGVRRVYTPKDFRITEIMDDVVDTVEDAWLEKV